MFHTKLTFGKYKGKRLSKVPTEYLQWLLDSSETLTDSLRKEIEQEIAGRADKPVKEDEQEKQAPPTKIGLDSPLGQSLVADVRMLFKSMAFKYHPDRGGSEDAMRALNDFHEQVQDLLQRAFKSL